MTEVFQAPRLTDDFAPGSGAFRIELYEADTLTGSLNASPSIVRENEIDLDGIMARDQDTRRGGLLVARWLLNAHDYGYDTAHLVTGSPYTLRSFQYLLEERPLGAYESCGADEFALADLTAAGAIKRLAAYKQRANEGPDDDPERVEAQRKFDMGISARFHVDDEMLMLRARRITGFQP